MNIKHIFPVALLALIVGVQSPAKGQGLKGRWGFGFGFGAQQQYSDLAVTPFGMGGEGLLTYRLTDKLSINLAAGYNLLGFKLPGVSQTFKTNLFFGDLFLDYELLRAGRIAPFVMAGIGGFNFQVEQSKRFNDAEGLLGGGIRFFLNPTTALSLSGSAKYTTGDDLDGGTRGGNKINDAYLTIRGGVTVYMGPKSNVKQENLFTKMEDETQSGDAIEFINEGEEAAEEKAGGEEDAELGEFLNRLSDLEGERQELQNQKPPTSMEEFVKLRSRIDELNAAIEQKEKEIFRLQQEIASKEGTINAFQRTTVQPNTSIRAQVAAARPAPVRSITAAYEAALNKFYSRRYAEAISMFDAIIRKYPQHSLASNCQYWIGESYFAAGDYLAAIQAFKKVFTYERTLKRDDALFMMGRAYMQLGKNDLARDAFNQLIAQFPDSEYQKNAMKYLNRL